MNKFVGTGVALATPFDKNRNIDWDGLENLLNHTSENGVDYLVVLGTTGESATVTPGESKDILSFIKKNNKRGLPIVLGCGGNNTAEVLNRISEIEFEGVDAILSVAPYYNKPPQEGIFQHFSRIADQCPVPVVLYNVPGRTASNISVKTTIRLSEHSNIIGIKESSGDINQAMEIVKEMPNDFLLISGDDMLSNAIIACGGSGTISVLANAFPEMFSDMVNQALNNRFNEANILARKLMNVDPLMYRESNPVGLKQALKTLKICDNYVRLPLVEASPALQKEMVRVISEMM